MVIFFKFQCISSSYIDTTTLQFIMILYNMLKKKILWSPTKFIGIFNGIKCVNKELYPISGHEHQVESLLFSFSLGSNLCLLNICHNEKTVIFVVV